MLSGWCTSRTSGYRYTLLGVKAPALSRTRLGFLVAVLITFACTGIAVWTFVDFETFSIWPAPQIPSLHDRPPLYSDYHERELRLPQQEWTRTRPVEHEKYFHVSGFLIDVGWGNAFEEHLFNAYLAYRLGRTFVFANYTWRDDGSQYTHSFGHTIPSQIPYTALIRGPAVGEPWGPGYEHVPSAVTKTYFDHVCTSKSELFRPQVHIDLPYGSDTTSIIGAWSKAASTVEDPCLQTRKSDGAVFTHQETFGVPGNLATIWPDLVSTPLLTHFAWSPLVELAFDANRDLFLPASLLSTTPYLSSLSYNPSLSSSSSPNAARYPPIPGLIAIHVRKGDYATHCSTLAAIGDPFVSVNHLPVLPDPFLPPGVPGPVMPNMKLAPPGTWRATAAQRAYYRRRCYPSIPEIVQKVLDVRQSPAAPADGLRRLHIMTNAQPAYISRLKRALWDAAEWDSISSSRDLVLNWEQKFVAQAVDVLVAQRAQVLIGNGFSTLTSNAVIMRLANNFSAESTRFW